MYHRSQSKRIPISIAWVPPDNRSRTGNERRWTLRNTRARAGTPAAGLWAVEPVTIMPKAPCRGRLRLCADTNRAFDLMQSATNLGAGNPASASGRGEQHRIARFEAGAAKSSRQRTRVRSPALLPALVVPLYCSSPRSFFGPRGAGAGSDEPAKGAGGPMAPSCVSGNTGQATVIERIRILAHG